jgi:antibiotic biosynthesis monooxygenase (ABM) superfamily enzyme
VSSQPELPAGATGPVTATVTRRVRPGHEAAYEEFLAGISGAAKAFPGYLGEEVFRPAGGGGGGGEYRMIYRFDPPAHLQAWLGSAERAAWLRRAEAHVAGPLRAQYLTGLESWFTPPSPAPRRRRRTRWPSSPG